MHYDEEFEKEFGGPRGGSLYERTNVWYEKYRPQSVSEVILPEHLKAKILGYLKDGGKTLPHLGLFSRTPGTGKSSLAKAIVKDLNAEALWINASMDKGIDVLRGRIQRFAANHPLRDCVKVVVMDEFDHFTKDGQAAFRGFIDQFGENVRFIFTGNYQENIIEPLLDRLEVYDFSQFRKEDMVRPIFGRLQYILTQENIQFEKQDLVEVIRLEYPKIRKMIGLIGQSLQDNRLVVQTISSTEELEELADLIRGKNYQAAIKKCYTMAVCDHLYGYFGSHPDKVAPENQMVNAIIILAKYQNMAVTARDKALNAAACVSELMKLN